MLRTGYITAALTALLPCIAAAASPPPAVNWHAYAMAIRAQRDQALQQSDDLRVELMLSTQASKQAEAKRDSDWHDWLKTWCGGWPGRCTGPEQQHVHITTSPAGARCVVHRDGKWVGVVLTPGDLSLEKSSTEDLAVRCEAAGYAAANVIARGPQIDLKLLPVGNSETSPAPKAAGHK